MSNIVPTSDDSAQYQEVKHDFAKYPAHCQDSHNQLLSIMYLFGANLKIIGFHRKNNYPDNTTPTRRRNTMANTQTGLKIVEARKSKLVQNTGFKGYDVCMNPYVGCQFGCTYCYVRFFIKDSEADWGEFVRLRSYIADKLPNELPEHYGKRIVLGTMTDPYQPLERKHRLTRATLDALLAMEKPMNKVGIFTRSPIVLEDLDRIVKLPRCRVHYTITPYSPEILRRIEPIAIQTKRRFETVKALKEAGVRVHVNVAPALPVISDKYTQEFAEKLAELKVDEFFVDPMQPYSESWSAITDAMRGIKVWKRVAEIVGDKQEFADWKARYHASWDAAWKAVQSKSSNTLPIWSDHVHKVWIDMRNGKQMDHKKYGDDKE